MGRPQLLTVGDRDALFAWLIEEGWRTQYEMRWWLFDEREVLVSQSTISRLLKKMNWSRRNIHRLSLNRSEEARTAYRQSLAGVAAEDLIFLDESIFNEKTGWRSRGYGPIGSEARYTASTRRGKTHSILAATSTRGWIPCTGVREGYFNTEAVLAWLADELWPSLRALYGHRVLVIVLDNCSTHCDQRVRQSIEGAGYLVRYLPPYSPDYNPIELSFATLKAWIKRYYHFLRPAYDSFEDFLLMAITTSRCDQFAQAQFKHAAGGSYIAREELESVRARLRAFLEGEDIEELLGADVI